jgi:hypothetical protein
MADNILTVDRNAANIDIAAKEVGGIKLPRNILTDPDGNDLTPLTDTALRATPVPVSGTVELGSTSLAALESITVAGTIEMGATSLAALENVTVGGTLELGATSLAALESVSAVGPLTNAELRAVAVPVAATSVDLGAQADSAASTDTDPASLIGLTKRLLQRFTTLLARMPALGPTTAAGSQPVVIASDQAAFPVTVATNGQATMANSLPVVIASNQTALPLSTGAATEATLGSIDAKTPALLSAVPPNNASAPPVRAVGQDLWVCSFAGVGASVLSSDFITPIVGTGVTYNQTAGSLNIVTGTSTNAEFLTRSVKSWRGSLRMRFSLVASARVANTNLQVTLADLIGSGLAYTIVSATVVDVTLAAHGYTAQNVGQFMNLGGITGAAGVPGRYAVASIPDANTIRFTVAAWPGSGSGTLTLFGHSYVRNLVNGTTATNLAWDTQRKGWAAGDTTATVITTATPGAIYQNELTGRDAFLHNSLRASVATPTFAAVASRYENMPDDDTSLYVFLWSYNGTVAPVTTTWTLGFVSVEKFANTPVYIQGVRANGAANPLAVAFPAAQSVAQSGTWNVTVNAAVAAGANAIGDVGVQYRANATGAATLTNINCPATPAAQQLKSGAGRLVGLYLFNTSASVRWVKIFNLASASVTPGTTAATTEIGIPAGGRLEMTAEGGAAFSTGITVMITGAAGLTNNTAVTLADVTGFSLHA